MESTVTPTSETDGSVIEAIAQSIPQTRDRLFYQRCWRTAADVYERRLRAVGMTGHSHVLDAGCGYGQWSAGLCRLNSSVTLLDFDAHRVDVAHRTLTSLGLTGFRHETGSVEELPFPDAQFDAVFSYGVVCLTDYTKTLREFARVLRPGGLCYFNTNALGWYVFNLLVEHNNSEDFSSRQMAIDTLENTIRFLAKGEHTPGQCIVMPPDLIHEELSRAGLTLIASGPDGSVCLDESVTLPDPFFPPQQYGLDNVFEIVCRKS